MRRMLMITVAALALGTTGALAAQHGMGGRGGGPAAIGGGGMAHRPMGGGMVAPNSAAPNAGANVHANVGGNVAAQANLTRRGNMTSFANAPNQMTMHGDRYAYRGDHDHDRWHGHGHWGGYGGLYAFGGPDYDYDDEYYDNSTCYRPRWVPTPYGWRWRDVWVCD